MVRNGHLEGGRSKRGLTDQEVTGTVKFGGGSLMMWGCMTAQGVGYSCKIDGTMDADLYTSILDDEFLNTLEYYGMEKDEIIFQQDNDPQAHLKKGPTVVQGQ